MNNDPGSNFSSRFRRIEDTSHAFESSAFTYDANTLHQNLQQGMPGDQAWAHWEYNAEEWALFDHIDWQAARRGYWPPNLIGLVCLLILGLSLLFLPAYRSLILTPAIFLVIIVFLLFVLRMHAYSEAKKRHQARQNQAQPHRVTFSKEGVWEAGTYFPLKELFWRLRSVRMTSQPAVLHFHREQRHIRASNEYDALRVLVPRGHEEEAARLMQRFRAEVIKAKKPTYNRPEPV